MGLTPIRTLGGDCRHTATIEIIRKIRHQSHVVHTRYDLLSLWYLSSLRFPGHTLDTFPEDCAAVRDAGMEIGLHGYSHENPADMTFEQQRDVLDKTYKQLTEFCGKPPRGSVAPWWETSAEGTDLLLSYGIEYDHSMSHEDHKCYWLRTGDEWTKIDYTKNAVDWMKPLVRGKETGLVEIPGSWYSIFPRSLDP
jgi:peptidoglycan/xylan/chitin deacetylase (PgdA/CDA1 family)